MIGPKPPGRGSVQLVFDLAQNPSYSSEEFLIADCNEVAYAALASWPNWPDRVMLLLGPAGSGKSHLAAIWAARSAAFRLETQGQLESAARPDGAEAALLEDVDRSPVDEAHLFHLLNSVREAGRWLLLTGRQAPDWWGLKTPDLVSRLRLAPSVLIGPPDLTLMKAVLVKLFADRQMDVDEGVISYASRHCERSLGALRSFVAAVDEASLAAGRRITRPLAISTIEALGDCPPMDYGPT